MTQATQSAGVSAAFRAEYAAHRAAEGRGYDRESLLTLPYLERGPFADQWEIRARTFDAFLRRVLRPATARAAHPLRVLDLGAGNGWLCYRVALERHYCVACDIRDDEVDGLGTARLFLRESPVRFESVAGSFAELPFQDDSFDIAVFNASLHYALDLKRSLTEAARVLRPGGKITILDSPFYRNEAAGLRMVGEKHRDGAHRFGARAGVLLSLPFIEFLTRSRLEEASRELRLGWRRHRVRYPLRYEMRPLVARLRGARSPSRFDLWESTVP